MNKNAIIAIAKALLETIQESPNGAPAGPMYAATMGMIDLSTFEAIMQALVEAGKVKKVGHVYYAA